MRDGRISAGNALHLARHIRSGHWNDVDSSLLQAIASARSNNCDRVLLSSEWLLGSFAHDERLIKFSQRLHKLGDHSLELLLVLRDPVGQFISLYKHRAKAGSVGSIDNWARAGYDLPLRLGGLRRQITSIPAKVVVRGYGKESGALERLFFEDWLRVAVPKESRGFLVNPSLTLSELVLLRKLRGHHPGLVPFLYERLLALDPSVKLEGQAMQSYARQVAVHAVAHYSEEWAHWNEFLPVGERFEVPESGPQPQSEPSQLELAAAQLAVMMHLLAEAVGPRLRLQLLWSWRVRPLLARIKRAVLPWHSRR